MGSRDRHSTFSPQSRLGLHIGHPHHTPLAGLLYCARDECSSLFALPGRTASRGHSTKGKSRCARSTVVGRYGFHVFVHGVFWRRRRSELVIQPMLERRGTRNVDRFLFCFQKNRFRKRRTRTQFLISNFFIYREGVLENITVAYRDVKAIFLGFWFWFTDFFVLLYPPPH